MACGVPVILSNVAGADEIVKHMENGLLVNLDNDEGILDAMKSLLKNSKLRLCLRDTAIRKIKQEYTCDIMAKNFEEILIGLVHG